MSQKALTLPQKIELLDKVKTYPPNLSQRRLAQELKIPRATLLKILKDEKNKLREEAVSLSEIGNLSKKVKRKRSGKDEEVEEAL